VYRNVYDGRIDPLDSARYGTGIRVKQGTIGNSSIARNRVILSRDLRISREGSRAQEFNDTPIILQIHAG
jgi:hypothetical protein